MLLLTAEGFTAPAAPIKGQRGLAAVAQDEADLEAWCTTSGARWLPEDNVLKAYASGVVSHAVIDAGVRVRARSHGSALASAELVVHPVVLEVMGVEALTDGLEGKSAPATASRWARLTASAGRRSSPIGGHGPATLRRFASASG
jgi:2-methylcitrate dehydratase PrpD